MHPRCLGDASSTSAWRKSSRNIDATAMRRGLPTRSTPTQSGRARPILLLLREFSDRPNEPFVRPM
eukprot:844470-Pyramimonas_sp.AAC.1